MDEKQAIKFWNAIVQGELLHSVPDNQTQQGYDVFKPTYASAVCDQHDLRELIVPRISYGHMGQPTGTYKPNKEDTSKVVEFLRMVADSIEKSCDVEYYKNENQPTPPFPQQNVEW